MNIAEFVNAEVLSIEREKGCNELSYWHFFSIPISEILLLFNASAHFFVYLFFDKTFQAIAKARLFSLKHYIQCSFENPRHHENQRQEMIPLEDKEDGIHHKEVENSKSNCLNGTSETLLNGETYM